MVQRIHFIVALIAALIGFASLPAAAQSGRIFYIDYAGGSNANAGTSTGAAWKSHPYMQNAAGCAGAPHAYTHQAGDRFIFKSGVTWPTACFQMSIPVGGASGNPDYYGVDFTWYSGGSFTRPKFDLAQTIPTGERVIQLNSATYITLDNIEIANQGINARNDDPAIQGSGVGIRVTNFYIHDWITTGAFTNTLGGPGYYMGSIDGGHVTLDHSEISDALGFAYNSTGNKITVPFGGSCHNCQEVAYSKIHDVMAACFTVWGGCHDSEFYNISQTLWDAAPPTGFGLSDAAPLYARPHTQVIEDDWPQSPGGDQVYNNLIHDNSAGVTIYVPYSSYIYNNVMWNNSNIYIRLTTAYNDTSSNIGYVYNNTVDCSNKWPCVGMDKGQGAGTLNLKNNHWITNGAPTCFGVNGCYSIATVNQSNNVTMSTSTAASQGYTTLNYYQSTAETNGTVGQGVNLGSPCSGNVAALCVTSSAGNHVATVSRPTGTTAWDVGAYQLGSAAASGPAPPASLTALVN